MVDVIVVIGIALSLAGLTILAYRGDSRLPLFGGVFARFVLAPTLFLLFFIKLDGFAIPIRNLEYALSTTPHAALSDAADAIQMLVHALKITNFISVFVTAFAIVYTVVQLPRIGAARRLSESGVGGPTKAQRGSL
jgi:hypothetical protein